VNFHKTALKFLIVPGGVVFGVAFAVIHSRLPQGFVPAVNFFYLAAFFSALVLAWRFHSSRVFSALVLILLAHQAVRLFSNSQAPASGLSRPALELVSFLVPLNLVVLAFTRERGFTTSAAMSRLGLLFVQSVFVAVLCRPPVSETGSLWFHATYLNPAWFPRTDIPQLALLVSAVVITILMVRALIRPKPVDAAFVWALMSFLMALHVGGIGIAATVYCATAAIIFAVSIIETSYAMAYRDELTGVPSRRAFHDAILQLRSPYAIAMVDIDHFKSVNDTYGHDTGDEVLCMVAAKLSRVTGGGQTFRVGGEEFCIVFPGRSATEILADLECLRTDIEASVFRLRGSDRRSRARGSDRRSASRSKKTSGRRVRSARYTSSTTLRITVSIGVAEPDEKRIQPNDVIKAADQALYRAKHSGRNRVEFNGTIRSREKPKTTKNFS
jgi:diguanylate cyclase (GGDEF)-like protein